MYEGHLLRFLNVHELIRINLKNNWISGIMGLEYIKCLMHLFIFSYIKDFKYQHWRVITIKTLKRLCNEM